MPYRIAAGLLGLFFFVQGINWLANPAAAAGGLGMPLLEGMARSTQIGDLAGFFLCVGGFALFGAYSFRSDFLRAAGILVGLSSITRTIAWAFHDAPFATAFITIEVLAGSALFFCASRVGSRDSA